MQDTTYGRALVLAMSREDLVNVGVMTIPGNVQ